MMVSTSKELLVAAVGVCCLLQATTLVRGAPVASEAGHDLGCFYTYWSVGLGYSPAMIDPHNCNIVFYSFVEIVNGRLQPYADDSNFHNNIVTLTELREANPGMRIMISVGGGAAGSAPFLYITQSQAHTEAFVDDTVRFLRQYDLDGIDIDWESPWCYSEWDADSHAGLMQALYTRLKAEAGGRELLVSGSLKPLTQHNFDSNCNWIPTPVPFYDVPRISSNMDFANIMTYDLRGTWNGVTGLHAALYGPEDNSDAVMQSFVDGGMPPSMMLLGIPTYGRSWTLPSTDPSGVGAPSSSPGNPGDITWSSGILSYTEICRNLKNGWSRNFDYQRIGAYAQSGNQWVGYDDVESARVKANFIQSKGYGGAMYWALEFDDFNNLCGAGKYPIMSAVAEILAGSPPPSPPPTAAPTDPPGGTGTTTPSTTTSTPSTTTTSSSSGVICTPSDDFLADPNDCGSYYRCVGMVPVHNHCPYGLAWNQEAKACDWPRNVPGCS